MRTRTIAALVLAGLLPLTACGGRDDDRDKPEAKASFDCTSQDVGQAEWMKHCSDEEGSSEPSLDLKFGQSYTWPDGLKVSVIDATRVTKFGEYESKPDLDETGFRVRLKLTNRGKTPAQLDKLSTIIEGATNGGEAASTDYEEGSEPLEGRLAPGVTTVKTDDGVLEKRHGSKIVVRVQRWSDDFDQAFPEFTGTIIG